MGDKSIFDVPWVKLSNGVELPPLGLGCAQLEDNGDQNELVSRAIGAGYRLFDTAALYGNEEQLGAALKESGAERGEIMVSSKLYGNLQGYDNCMRGFEKTLELLGLEYLDLYLIHWPAENPDDSLGSWKAMESLYQQKLIRAIGLSNFNQTQIGAILAGCSVPPMVLQTEFNPYHSCVPLREYCAGHGIAVEGYFPLGGQVTGSKGIRKPPPAVQLFEHPIILGMAKKYDKTAAQVILRWEVQSGVIALPKTTKVRRLEENISIFDFELTDQEMALTDTMNYDFSIGPGEDETNVMQ